MEGTPMDSPINGQADEQAAPDKEAGGQETKSMLGNVMPGAGDNKEGEQGADGAVSLPDSPEGYAFEFEPDTQVDTELLGQYQKWAHENKVPLESAVALAKGYEARVKAMMEQHRAGIHARTEEWYTQIQKDPELGGANFSQTQANIGKAFASFGSEALQKTLLAHGLDNNPEVIRFFNKVGAAFAEPKFATGDNSGREKSAAEVLYPASK